MVQGINKEYIFNKKIYKKRYIKLLKKAQKGKNVKIIAYCIMDNHAHLLIKMEKIIELSKFMQTVNSEYGKYYNFMEKRVGYVFRDRYKHQVIKDQKQLIQCIKYIHQNPIKAGIVINPDDYIFSSYNFYKMKLINSNKTFLNLNFEEILKSSESYGNFIDIENNPSEVINNLITEFLQKENVKIFEIFEKNDILKKLIKYLKKDNQIKYVYIMEKFGITKGVMERLKK